MMLLHWLQDGGMVFMLLLVLAFAATVLIIAKAIQLLYVNSLGQQRLHHVLQGTTACPSDSRRPALQLLYYGQHNPKASRQHLQQCGQQLVWPLQWGLRPLELLANLAPLLGLLGTVLGMIEVFQQLQQAGPALRTQQLAGGIWQALLTTAAGLTIAIPASAALSWLESRIERHNFEIHQVIDSLLQRQYEPR